MKILFLSPYLPSETSGHAGAQLIFRNMVTLSKTNDIELLSFINKEELNQVKTLERIGIRVKSILYNRNRRNIVGKVQSIASNAIPAMKSLIGKDIFFISKYNKLSMKNLLMRELDNFNPKIIQFEYNVMYHYANLIPNQPKVLVLHDVTTKMMERSYKNSKGIIKKTAKYYQLKNSERLEQKWIRKFEHLITLTVGDKQFLLSKWKDLPSIEVIPPQVPIPELNIIKDKNQICYIGSFNREPNIIALKILLDNIFPEIKKTNSNIKLKIAGKYLPISLKKKIGRMKNVHYYGFVENIDSFLAESILCLAPIFIGSGLKMKNTHALACGTAVLTTSVGAEGIPFSPREGLWVENSISKMIDRCLNLLREPKKLIKAGVRGRKAVSLFFSEEIVTKKFLKLYDRLLK